MNSKRTFREKPRFHELDMKIFESNIQTWLKKGTAFSIESEQCSVGSPKLFSFELKARFPESPFCCKLTSKMCFRFPNCSNMFRANVQKFNNQFENSEKITANCWIIHEVLLFFRTTSKMMIADTSYQTRSCCAKPCELENKISNEKKKWLLNQQLTLVRRSGPRTTNCRSEVSTPLWGLIKFNHRTTIITA